MFHTSLKTCFPRITRTKGHCLTRSAQRHYKISFKVSFNLSLFLNPIAANLSHNIIWCFSSTRQWIHPWQFVLRPPFRVSINLLMLKLKLSWDQILEVYMYLTHRFFQLSWICRGLHWYYFILCYSLVLHFASKVTIFCAKKVVTFCVKSCYRDILPQKLLHFVAWYILP